MEKSFRDKTEVISNDLFLGNKRSNNNICKNSSPYNIKQEVKWTYYEDFLLKDIASTYLSSSKIDWHEVSKKFLNKSASICKERWNYLSVENVNWNEDDLSENELWLLFLLYTKLKTKWAKIKKFFFNRSKAFLKDYWDNQMTSKIKQFYESYCLILQESPIENEKQVLDQLIEKAKKTIDHSNISKSDSSVSIPYITVTPIKARKLDEEIESHLLSTNHSSNTKTSKNFNYFRIDYSPNKTPCNRSLFKDLYDNDNDNDLFKLSSFCLSDSNDTTSLTPIKSTSRFESPLVNLGNNLQQTNSSFKVNLFDGFLKLLR